MARRTPVATSRPQRVTRPRYRGVTPFVSRGVPALLSGRGKTAAGGSTPGGGGGVAAAPAAPAYSVSNLPPDASYDAALAQLQRQRDQNLAGIAGARFRGLNDYGFTEGPGGAIAYDPNNPFSKAALLKKSFDTNRRATGQNMAAGGQLYAGAFQNAQDLVNRNQLQAEDAQSKALIGFLAQNTQQQAQSRTDYETAAQQAFGDRIGRFASNPLYDPATAESTSPQAAPRAAPWAGRPTKTRGGKRYYKRPSDGQWIPY